MIKANSPSNCQTLHSFYFIMCLPLELLLSLGRIFPSVLEYTNWKLLLLELGKLFLTLKSGSQ